MDLPYSLEKLKAAHHLVGGFFQPFGQPTGSVFMEKLDGDGMAFVHAGGYIIEKDLGPGEILKVDTGCVVAFQP